MTTQEMTATTPAPAPPASEKQVYKDLYRAFAYFGLISILGAQLYGLRYSESAPFQNYGYNLLLYAAFAGWGDAADFWLCSGQTSTSPNSPCA